jgi:glycosyltransferase involved in cell wall biosynthesis
MRKLLIVGPTNGSYGGLEAFMIVLAQAASKWDGFDVKICFKVVNGFTASPNLISISKTACKDVYFIKRASLQLLKLIAWADVLHVQNMPPDIVFPAKLLRKKIFLTVHNRRMTTRNLHNLLWRLSITVATQRWYNSKFVWSTWEPKKKSVRSSCIPTVSRLPQTCCDPDSRRGFLFMGRWIENKGIEEILKAYALNHFNLSDWPLTILGDGPLKPKILGLIEELGLQEVSMPGFVSENIKDDLISNSRWILAPANTQEDLGLTPIEGRSVGVPSIVTRDGGLPESGGEAAIIAEPGDFKDLARCMQIAAEMPKHEYLKRSILAKASLEGYLKPLDFYRHAYTD